MATLKAKPDEIEDFAEALRQLRDDISQIMSDLNTAEAATANVAKAAQEVLAKLPPSQANDPHTKAKRPPPLSDIKDYDAYSKRFFGDAVKLLGGRSVWKKTPANTLEVHEAVQRGISSKALAHLVQQVTEIPNDKLFNVVGVSLRTVQRKASAPEARLSQAQSSRLWKLAQVLGMATELFGDRKAAERWLNTPAVALDRRLPIDLMTTEAGAEMVEQLIGRLEYGVYT